MEVYIMALIKCPECGKEISDKAELCINCGYPIRTTPYIHEIINGEDIDLSFLKNNAFTQTQKIQIIQNLSGCDLYTAKQIVNKYCPTVHMPQQSPQVKCPRCGSTNIQMVPRKFSLLTGFMTNKVDRVCMNCKHKF